MKTIARSLGLSIATRTLRVSPALLAPALIIAGCATTQQRVAQKEDALSAAGFVSRPANTPARQAMLTRLPPHKFVQRTHGNVTHYVYADPTGCNCLYVGTQQAYGKYVRQMQRQNLADTQLMAAQAYSDPAWNWGGWGDSYGGRFGGEFGGGFGYDRLGW